MRTAAALVLVGLSAAACTVTTSPPPGGGGGGGGGGGLPQPAPLPSSLSTADGDDIGVSGQAGSGSGPAQLCLTSRAGMWRKELRIAGGTTLVSENGTSDCANVDAGFVRFEIVKAKAFGVMTGVGNGSLDLTGWGGGTVTVEWKRD